MKNFFITAIGTDSGKTLVSAIFCEAFNADYWKPVQAGEPFDSATVKSMLSNPNSQIQREAYALKMPASPHASARAEGIVIDRGRFILPRTTRPLVVEGAGGALVPLNDEDVMIDIASWLDLPVVLVSNYYLGSINHTLLSYEVIKLRGLKIIGIVFNGDRNDESRRIILRRTGLPCLLDINVEKEVTPEVVKKYAKTLNENWKY